jgi:hypothetical protein
MEFKIVNTGVLTELNASQPTASPVSHPAAQFTAFPGIVDAAALPDAPWDEGWPK